MGFTRRFNDWLLLQTHWRCAEPVLVLESDDWGLERTPCAELLSRYGEATDWALESTESAEDLEELFAVLLKHRDQFGRPACMTANFVVSNPDYSAIERSGFSEYHNVPIDVSCPPDVMAKYREGIEEKCFYPQYHGLRHFHPLALLRDLRSDFPGARELFYHGSATGLGMIRGMLWRYHSEYQECGASQFDSLDAIQSTCEAGLAIFERCFGFRSQSTIPPHYLVSDDLFPAFCNAGFRYIQGGNYQVRYTSGRTEVQQAGLGMAAPAGLRFLARNVKLEPRPTRSETVEQAIEAAGFLCEARIPVVVDTHRINYTGQFRRQALEALDQFLSGMASKKPTYMTSAELGAAVENAGLFGDFSGAQQRTLGPIAGTRTAAARLAISQL